jgi:hypothetical protein
MKIGQIGNAPGNYITGAPNIIASAGITIGQKTGWFGSLRYRYLGARPLTERSARLRRHCSTDRPDTGSQTAGGCSLMPST